MTSVCSPFEIPIYYILNSILNVVAATFILFFSEPAVLVVSTAIQNKDNVSQPPVQPEEARWLFFAGRMLFGSCQGPLDKNWCPLPFLVYFSSHLLPGAQLCWPELSPPRWSWGQGPYSGDVGQWCRSFWLREDFIGQNSHTCPCAACIWTSTYKRNAFLFCLNHYFGPLSLTAESNPNWWHVLI